MKRVGVSVGTAALVPFAIATDLAFASPGPARLEPLDTVRVHGTAGRPIVVRDSKGHTLFRGRSSRFTVGGALGPQTVAAIDPDGRERDLLRFEVDARTAIDDEGGAFRELLDICRTTMRMTGDSPQGSVRFEGRRYPFFVPWILDHVHVAKGAQYFATGAHGLVEVFAKGQRADGMVWSFVRNGTAPGYYPDAYAPYGYAAFRGGATFARQPVENHNEYMFVNGLHLAWKSSGDDAWAKGLLDSARRALDYSVTDPARWSTKFGLLKRGYTIDSWDFLLQDGHIVPFPLATEQMIDPERTKFGVFFGDNHGYATACEQLAEMLARFGRPAEADVYRRRAGEIRKRLDALAWNGRFFTHWVPEDPSVKRDLGVDEKAQIAMSNAYALNRGVTPTQARAILRTYEDLRTQSPPGSPGEWYAIFPPFERGLGGDNGKWQYMNGGVHGHAAGELARGAYEAGAEAYGTDILRRLRALGKAHGNKLYFAYTGAVEPPPAPPTYRPVALGEAADMSLGSDGAVPWMNNVGGNDLARMPRGDVRFDGVPYRVERAIAVARSGRYAKPAAIPVGAKAGAVHLLHAVSGSAGAAAIAGTVTFRYEDGTSSTTYLRLGQEVSGWWYPSVTGPEAGIAWRGANARSGDVGVSRVAIPNPRPDLTIDRLEIGPSLESDAVYAVMGVTLADRMPYSAPSPLSTGGPDNWTGGTVTAALVEGLVGLRDEATKMDEIRLSPRWSSAGVRKASATVRYAASNGYVAYRYAASGRRLNVRLTGSGRVARLRLLLPREASGTTQATLDGRPIPTGIERVGDARYATATIPMVGVRDLSLVWK